MVSVPPPVEVATVVGVILFGGLVTGVTGFGFALASTTLLALVLDPATAVVLVVVPLLATNLQLVLELERAGLRRCVERFWPYVAAATAGTVLGMLLLRDLPAAALSVALGLLALAFVAVDQPWIGLPGRAGTAAACRTERPAAMVGLGVASGLVFGASNVGVQVVAYLRGLDLDHATFVGVLAMIMVGVSTVRVGTAAALGLYESAGLFALSAAVAVPAVAGVRLGQHLRERVPVAAREVAVYGLLAVVGFRLTLRGLGVG